MRGEMGIALIIIITYYEPIWYTLMDILFKK